MRLIVIALQKPGTKEIEHERMILLEAAVAPQALPNGSDNAEIDGTKKYSPPLIVTNLGNFPSPGVTSRSPVSNNVMCKSPSSGGWPIKGS